MAVELCVHAVPLTDECVSCARDLRRGIKNDAVGWRVVDPAATPYQPGELPDVIVTEEDGGSKTERLAVAPGMLRTPLPEVETALQALVDLGAIGGSRGAQIADLLSRPGIGRGPAKVALVMKDAMALGLVENAAVHGAEYRYRLTDAGAQRWRENWDKKVAAIDDLERQADELDRED